MPSIGHTTRTVQSEGFTREKADERFLSPRRNLLINGGFDIWQRGTSFTGSVYTADRWKAGDGGGKTLSRELFTLGQTSVPGNPLYYWRCNTTTAATAVSTAIYQRIEGVQALAGKAATLSIWLKAAATKTFTVRAIQIFGSGGTPSTDVVTTVGYVTVGTTWQQHAFVVDIPSIAGKILGTDGNDCLQIDITEETDFSTYTLDVAQVQLEEGDIATPFEKRHIGEELALCRRYYEIAVGWFRAQPVGGFVGTPVYYSVNKRTIPSVSYSGSPQDAGGPFHNFYQNTVSGVGCQFLDGAENYNYGFTIEADAEL